MARKGGHRGSTVTFTTKCGDISIITAGVGYTATATTFAIYDDNHATGMNRVVNEFVFTKQ